MARARRRRGPDSPSPNRYIRVLADADDSGPDDCRMAVDARMSLRQLGRVCQRLEAVRRQQVQLLAERDELLAHLCDSGISRSELAKAAGLSPGRITQLLDQAQPRGLIASDD